MGACLQGTPVCYKCGGRGHIAASCPSAAPAPRPQGAPARVFTMTQGEADATPTDVICGNILVNGIIAYVLFDSGASHTFIARAFVKELGTEPEVLNVGYVVALPSGKTMRSNKVIKNCPIQIRDQILHADPVILDLVDFDLILGMDWLARYHATIQCREKKVVF